MTSEYTLGGRLRNMRLVRNITVTELAEHVGVSRTTIWSWESGRTRPRRNKQRSLLEMLNVAEDELIFGPNKPDHHAFWPTLQEQVVACRHHVAALAGVQPDAVEIIIKR